MGAIELHIARSKKDRKQLINTEKSVLFLAGPIRNALKWHDIAIRFIVSYRFGWPLFIVAPIHKTEKYSEILVDDSMSAPVFERQRAWELHYLELAAKKGCTVFWLSNPAPFPEHEGKVYAHITMMELGNAVERKRHEGDAFNLVVGVDNNFPEWETIKLDLDTKAPSVPICYTLEDTIKSAIKLIEKQENNG